MFHVYVYKYMCIFNLPRTLMNMYINILAFLILCYLECFAASVKNNKFINNILFFLNAGKLKMQ